MIRSGSASAALLAVLRQALRRNGWSARSIASHLAIGEATAKRWLAGRGLSLERLERLAALAGLSLADLARAAEQPAPGLAQELTLAQERGLSADIFLAFLFMSILGGIRPEEIAQDFAVPEATMEAMLGRLERLALIDRLPGGRVRPLVDRAILWRKTPMRRMFEEHMKPQFLAMDFGSEDAVFFSEVLKLSDHGAAELAELFERHRREIRDLAERDRDHSLLARRWYGVMSALRPLDMRQLENAGRNG